MLKLVMMPPQNDFQHELEAYTGQSFPVISEAALCVLCEQPLTRDAAQRLSWFETFVKAETQKTAQNAKGRFDALHQNFLDQTEDLTAPDDLLAQLDLTHPTCATKIRFFLESSRKRQIDLIRPLAGDDWANIHSSSECPLEEIETIVTELDARAVHFERAKAPERLAELKAERDQLLARKNLGQRKAEVLGRWDFAEIVVLDV